jgi:valyl-tRNA synthetase
MIDREYRPAEVEPRWVREWIESGLFTAGRRAEAEPFTMVIPPPNVTGDLHIGHVLVYTLHDVVARWRRMTGRDTLWLPGTDHAGIATQAVVERELARQGKSRHDVGRAEFERLVWEWKDEYGGRILEALRRLGASVDWSRERFTLDPGLSRAVRTVFVRLYREGLIYRDRYIVNWCPRCHTAISDLETVHQPVDGKLYRIVYRGVDGGRDIELATTRPETLLGDTAVAVHPDDERYRDAVGGRVHVPLTGRTVPVVADPFVDPAFGTGAVKITPAHDPNDFQAARRLGLPELVVIDTEGRMTGAAGPYAGLDRFEARQRVLRDLKEQKLLLDTRPHEHAVGHCQRCGTMIEPLASVQWFVKIAPLAAPAIEAVESGRVRFVPANWAKTYFEWMRNIHDWCISRQLWWGHRIPAWYCDACSSVVVAEDDPEACSECGGRLRQDEDVLDTWFSSALWPFSTLGWPETTADLSRYYPTSVLITGHDIIFFWVARMIMMGLKFMGDVPFREVYIHGLVRDSEGQKMSKSKGNTIVPAEVQDRYGTDAVRFTMAILAAPGNDIPLAHERMDGYRAFANKLWNATRFVLMRIEGVAPRDDRAEPTAADRWILSRLDRTVADVDDALAQYRFDRAADLLYHFVWHEFCDWYIELVKPDFAAVEDDAASDAAARRAATTRAVLLEVLDTTLRVLHPFMPFLTEELWARLPGSEGMLAGASWPVAGGARIDDAAEREMEVVRDLAVAVRHMRVESNIDPGRRIEVLLRAEGEEAQIVERAALQLKPLVRADSVRRVDRFASDLVAARGVTRGVEIAIPLAALLDLDAERDRLRRDLDKVEREIESRARRLSNTSFLERAPGEVVERERRIQTELVERKNRLGESLANLGPATGGRA